MGDLTVGPTDALTVKQKGQHIGPGNTGLVPAPPPPAGPKGIPVPTVVKIDTGKPDSKRVQKVKHNGADANNEKTIFKGTIGDPMHVGDLPPSTPKKDVVSWVKENLGFTISGHPSCKAQKKGFIMVGAVAMANAGSKKAQIPMAWVLAGGAAQWSKACRAALIKCGIDPDAFGTYSARNKAQAQARKDWVEAMKKKHGNDVSKWPDPASQAELDRMAKNGQATQWVQMNSNSGHCIQNNFFQSERADSCTNYPPTRDPKTGAMTDTGGYGYEDNKAFCTDHMGAMTVTGPPPKPNAPHPSGSEHQDICNSEAAQRDQINNRAKDQGKVTPRDVDNNAQRTADINADPKGKGGKASGATAATDPVEKQRRETSDEARRRQAAELKANEKQKKAGGGATGAKGGYSKKPARGASAKDKKKAAQCIKQAAKQALLAQRAACMNEATKAPPPKPTPAAKKELLDQYNKRNGTKIKSFDKLPPEVQALGPSKTREIELRKMGAGDGNEAKKAPKHPNQQDCLEFQANQLHQENVMGGGLPPPAGQVKPPKSGGATAGGGGATGGP